MVRGGPEVRFHEGSTGVPPGFHRGSTRVPPGFHQVLPRLRGGAHKKKHCMLLGISTGLIFLDDSFCGWTNSNSISQHLETVVETRAFVGI